MTFQVDWTKIAESANCNTAKYARDKFTLIRNKLIAGASKENGSAGGDGGNANGEAVTPDGKAKKKATPRKRKTGKLTLSCSQPSCY